MLNKPPTDITPFLKAAEATIRLGDVLRLLQINTDITDLKASTPKRRSKKRVKRKLIAMEKRRAELQEISVLK